jgi:superfamily II DNA or RNA helicase
MVHKNNNIILQKNQNDQRRAVKKHNKGILTSPTGTGKTYPMAFTASDAIKEGTNIVMVKFPRISLVTQQVGSFTQIFNQELLSYQQPYQIMIHSGNDKEFIDYESLAEELGNGKISIKEYKKIEANRLKETCGLANIEAISSFQEACIKINAQPKGKPIVVYTTYHSNQKSVDIIETCGLEVELDLNDEAQYLVQENFFKCIENYSPPRQYFWTATLKSQVESWVKEETGRGMKNKLIFGDIIYSMSIINAIKDNLIVPMIKSWVSIGNTTISESDLDKNTYQIVDETFKDLDSKFKLGGKLLVAVGKKKQLRNLIKKSKHFADKGIELLTVHSDRNLVTYNGNIITREKFESLKDDLGKDENTKLIIAHYDILSEGIDIQGMLGVLILRNMNESKFLQTIGRACRIYRPNPELKKFGMVYFPNLDVDLTNNFEELIRKMRQEGYIPIEQFTPINRSGDSSDIPPLEEEGIARRIDLNIQLQLEAEDRIKSLFNKVSKVVDYSLFG